MEIAQGQPKPYFCASCVAWRLATADIPKLVRAKRMVKLPPYEEDESESPEPRSSSERG